MIVVPPGSPPAQSTKRCSLEFLCGMICFRTNVLKPLAPTLRDFCFGSGALHPLQRIGEQNYDEYERDLETIGNLGNNKRIGEPVEKGAADFVGEGCDEDAEHNNFGHH